MSHIVVEEQVFFVEDFLTLCTVSVANLYITEHYGILV